MVVSKTWVAAAAAVLVPVVLAGCGAAPVARVAVSKTGASKTSAGAVAYVQSATCRQESNGFFAIYDSLPVDGSIDWSTLDQKNAALTAKVDHAMEACTQAVNGPVRSGMYQLSLADADLVTCTKTGCPAAAEAYRKALDHFFDGETAVTATR